MSYTKSTLGNLNLPCSVRTLTEHDKLQVEYLDNLSGNDVKGWLNDNTDYAWGLFLDKKLIGYCTIGLADVLEFELRTFEEYTPDDLLLSDVFIDPKYRHNGFGQTMISSAISQRNKGIDKRIFLTLLDEDLQSFYLQCGFKPVCEGFMVK